MKKIGLFSTVLRTLCTSLLFTTAMSISLDDTVCSAPTLTADTKQISNDLLCLIIDDLINSTPEEVRILIQALLEDKVDLLKQKIYRKLRPLNNRSLFKMPLLRKQLPTTDAWELTVHTFYDQMHSPIGSYFKLNSKLFTEENLGLALSLVTDSTVDEFVNLARQVEVTQRRSGFMFNFIKRHNDGFYAIRVPLYYLERNYDAPGEPAIPTPFIRAHLVNDKIGLGDTEFSFAYYFHDTARATVIGGTEITLPTAITFHNGLYGSPYKMCGYRPNFNINTIIDNFFANNGDICTTINQFNDLGTQVVDQLSAFFLDIPLDAYHHPSVSLFMQPRVQLTEHWLFDGYGSLEYYIPKTEKRFFITKRHLDQFDSFDFTDDEQARNNLTFLSNQLLDALFFQDFDVPVSPGFVFELVGQVTLDYEAWQVHAGADFWLQTTEQLGKPCVPSDLKDTIDEKLIKKSIRKQAEQVRVFGGFQYTLDRNNSWILGFHGDATVWNRNIGKGFSVVFSLTSYF